ncbi:S-adenosyl-L-methionine-dependent methyltransferase [Coniella lustricola]|uniref:S-adenosyl-L-methionine-dependent methyltransferase n=1 Tax=Coniella lustricola TaxID=2025994 RepID=A0A2T2ZW29_9PEZI|nr:S-adenosyl-L-methionine-dependent methyltransferase [Coniella lustricola]
MTTVESQVPRQGTTAPIPGRTGEGQADDYEETHVHGVYEAIASHFSATRHKPWPFVSSFLARQLPGSVGLDVGCGNGKNMGVNRDVLMFGCDRSAALIALARNMWCSSSGSSGREKAEQQGRSLPPAAAVRPSADATVADSLALPFRDGCADFVICIAVIHHMSTRERRVEAIRQLLRCVRRGKTQQSSGHDDYDSHTQNGGGGGQVLVYVWALEQSTSRRGWDQGGEQDLLVPWVMKAPQPQQQQSKKEKKNKKANKNSKQLRNQKKQHPMQDKAGAGAGAAETQQSDKTFHRFYHLYRKGELEEDVLAAGGQVLESGYERDNWWVIAG